MPDLNSDLHGNAPDKSAVALMIIDMINDLEFSGGERLAEPAIEAARRTAELKARCQAVHVPVIYVNDNFGRWRSDFRQVIDRVLHDGVRGQPLAELLTPDPDDYFVLKPKHSAFFETTLETLLRYLGVRTLILTGITGDICVKLTANDAYMRDYGIVIPADCTASVDATENEHALAYCERVLKARITCSEEIDPAALKDGRAPA